MSATASPYREVLDRLRAEGTETAVLARVSELVALLEVATTLAAGTAEPGALDAALAIVARQLGVERAALFVRDAEGLLSLRAGRGLPRDAPAHLAVDPPTGLTVLDPPRRGALGLAVLVPIGRAGRPSAVLGLDAPDDGGPGPAPEVVGFLRDLAACAAAAIENDVLSAELRDARRKLSLRSFELRNLFDISRELTAGSAEEAVLGQVATTAMGHFVVARCAVYMLGPGGLRLALGRGLGRPGRGEPMPPEPARGALDGLVAPVPTSALPDGWLRRELERCRLVLAVPLRAGSRVEGLLAIGERASGMPFNPDDLDFARALALQAVGALETARLLRVRDEKQRQDRDLQIAREIQAGLFPTRPPDVPGFAVAAESRSCYAVGGDSYDWIPLEDGRLVLVVADVSGKGTPASLLMASVHASIRSLAGQAAPDEIVARLNRFLYASTQASRFVTLFYAELDPAARRLTFVNAGHVPPFRVGRNGALTRIDPGGPAVGLLEDASYEAGMLELEPGDLVTVMTDGITEARSPQDEELGDERVGETLRALAGEDDASAVLRGLVAAVDEWSGVAGCSDDLTALVLKAR